MFSKFMDDYAVPASALILGILAVAMLLEAIFGDGISAFAMLVNRLLFN